MSGGRTSDFIEAEHYLALCRMGKMRVIKEHGPYGPQIICINESGSVIVAISHKLAYLFEPFLAEHGNGDGLFEGEHQTAEVK